MTAIYPLRPRRNDRRLVRDRWFILRRLSASIRAMPDFLIVGAMKGGTSSLFNYLIQHPMIVPPIRKELHFFGSGFHAGKSEAWYRAHFPIQARLRGGKITGEATPGYMYYPGAADRLAAHVPNARLIVVLRNPVERAISHYFHEIRMGREFLPIDEAMAAEDTRLALAARDPGGIETYMAASYKTRGVYADQIERLRRLFPPKQILVLGSGDLFADPRRTTNAALEFLGLEPASTPNEFAVKNSGGDRPPVPDRVRSDLEAFFAPRNERLFNLLGRRLDW